MTPKRVVALLIAALAVYFVFIGYRGVYLIDQGKPVLVVLGAAVLALPLIGIWVVVAEVRFGAATERLGRRLPPSAGDEEKPLPRLPSGRVDRKAADARFAVRRAEVEAAPEEWPGWFRLAVAYDEAGDRRRAREAMRTAIARAEGDGAG